MNTLFKKVVGILALGAVILLPFSQAGSAFAAGQQESIQQASNSSYWDSRNSMGHLVFRTGMGVRFMAPMDKMKMMAKMAGLTPDQLPKDPWIVQAVYKSGDPHYVTPKDQRKAMDFSTLRWDPSTMDTTLTPASQAFTIIKSAEWAKDFYYHPYMPLDRFAKFSLLVSAKMTAKYAAEHLVNDKGLFAAKKGDEWVGQPNTFDQAAMLWAYSDLVSTITNKAEYPQLMDTEAAANFTKMANHLFDVVMKNPGTTIKDQSFQIDALVWYAAIANDANKQKAIQQIHTLSAELASQKAETAVDLAQSIRGIVEGYRTTGDDSLANIALEKYGVLKWLWDDKAGVFRTTPSADQYVYSDFDIGSVIGALNTLRINVAPKLHDRHLAAELDQYLAAFYNNATKTSGLQQANDNDPNLAPVPFDEVTYDTATSKWSVTNSKYVSADAMYLANEEIWMMPGHRDGYPQLSKRTSAQVLLNDQPVTLEADPMVKGDQVWVPVRDIAESAGATVSWNAETNAVSIDKDKLSLQIKLSANTFSLNNGDWKSVSGLTVKSGITFVPASFVEEGLGLHSKWSSSNKMMLLSGN